jgi:hypothetical protein
VTGSSAVDILVSEIASARLLGVGHPARAVVVQIGTTDGKTHNFGVSVEGMLDLLVQWFEGMDAIARPGGPSGVPLSQIERPN